MKNKKNKPLFKRIDEYSRRNELECKLHGVTKWHKTKKEKKTEKLIALFVLDMLILWFVIGSLENMEPVKWSYPQEAEAKENMTLCGLDVVVCVGEGGGVREEQSEEPKGYLGSGDEKSDTGAPVDSVLKKIGDDEGIDWKLLKAVCLTESGCKNPDCSIDGKCDNGQSFGAFQIHKPSHPDISIEQMNDFGWSARWTAKHGKKYSNDPAMFCKAHNGIGKLTNQWYIDKCLENYRSI